jgi:hypothetical protein
MPSPSCLSSIELVSLTDVIEVEVVDSLEREAVDEPDVRCQSSDGDLANDSIYPFGYYDNGEGVVEGDGEVNGKDGYDSHQSEESRGNELHGVMLGFRRSLTLTQIGAIMDSWRQERSEFHSALECQPVRTLFPRFKG